MRYCYKLLLLLIITVFVSSSSLSSQEIAITEDGKEVYLKADLSELSSEKAAYIKSHPDDFVVVEDKSELKKMNLYKRRDAEASGKTKREPDFYSRYKKGDISKEEAKAIYYEGLGDVNGNKNEGFDNSAGHSPNASTSGKVKELSVEEKAYRSVMGDQSHDVEMTDEEERKVALEVRRMKKELIEQRKKEQKVLEDKISEYTERGYTRDEAIEKIRSKKTSVDK